MPDWSSHASLAALVSFHYLVLNYCCILRKVIIEAKSNRDFITNSKNKGKAIWDVVKRETGKVPNNSDTIELLNNGQIIKTPHEVAEIFNKYFANVSNLNTTHTYSRQSNLDLNYKVRNNTMFLTPVTLQEILKIVKNLKNSLACGVDEIPDIII